jgi:hypothetical protein
VNWPWRRDPQSRRGEKRDALDLSLFCWRWEEMVCFLDSALAVWIREALRVRKSGESLGAGFRLCRNPTSV